VESAYDARYYEQVYRDYAAQNPPYKLDFYARQVERHRDPNLPMRIHDVGCGFAAFLDSLGARWERFGSESSEHALAEASRRCPDAVLRPGGIMARPPDAPFAVVTALDVIEHVPDPDAAAAAVDAQLLPGGLFFFVVPVYDGLSGPVIRWLDRDPTHLHRWSRRRWLDWAAASFEVLDWGGILRYLLPFGLYLHLPTRRLRWHTPAIWVACRKSA
jgi:SAM-dependent methyltransferase